MRAAERSAEHVGAAARLDVENFIVKHWALKHSESPEQPRMRFKVRGSFKDALTRIVTEAVLIDKESNMNSKAEWGYRKLNRLTIESPNWLDDNAVSEKKEEDIVNAKLEELKLKKEKKRTVNKEIRGGDSLKR